MTATVYALHFTRLAVRIAACIFAIIALSLNIAIGLDCVNTWTRFIEVTGEIGFEPATCWGYWQMPFLGISVVWNTAEFITLCLNKKGLHPAAHVALDFIVFAGLKAAGVYDAWAGGGHGFRLLEATCAFEILAGLSHLALFVMACVALRKWHRSRTPKSMQRKSTYVQVQEQNGMPHQYPLAKQRVSLPPPASGMA